ncbi:MAG: hypothetical protein AB8I08_25665 [Sandaracinaceae bacterium]
MDRPSISLASLVERFAPHAKDGAFRDLRGAAEADVHAYQRAVGLRLPPLFLAFHRTQGDNSPLSLFRCARQRLSWLLARHRAGKLVLRAGNRVRIARGAIEPDGWLVYGAGEPYVALGNGLDPETSLREVYAPTFGHLLFASGWELAHWTYPNPQLTLRAPVFSVAETVGDWAHARGLAATWFSGGGRWFFEPPGGAREAVRLRLAQFPGHTRIYVLAPDAERAERTARALAEDLGAARVP